jgi:hypothetical protein
MHVIVILLLVGIILFLLLRDTKSDKGHIDDTQKSSSLASSPGHFVNQSFVFISRGKLFLKDGDSENAVQVVLRNKLIAELVAR